MNETWYDGENFDSIQLFQGVGFEAVSHILEECPVVKFAPDDVIITPETPNTLLYLVLEGELSVRLGRADANALVSVGVGGCVGEMSVIDADKASAYVVAETPCRLIEVEDEKVWSLIHNSHDMACNLLYLLSRRMRFNNRVIMEGEEKQRALETSVRVDGLTGLYNRRWLDHSLERQFQRMGRDGGSLSLLMMDVDHFKRFNDTFGHLGGDCALRTLARSLMDHLRPGDMAARYGGEEFSVLLPETTLQTAINIAERLREGVAGEKIVSEEGKALDSITISIGVASTSAELNTPAKLVAAADAALYAAKQGGRNCVHAHGEE
ncbi:GGDEF domain-containing protein [Magnetofaba australis]|uniref:diguanylate cyclase n=1 Tax=Magnetofaba australis IT-1 TaxID=1434232 RepID=A0A1Y2K287_9PROT|nr:diguanylate cyclase [Magnetofaba australis]OSM02161.1 putative cyclic nucleotide-binding protein [Magnetofaba australis IT-1]